MTDHEITVTDRRAVKTRMEFSGDALTEDDIIRTNTLPDSERTFSCSCGKGGMSYQKAVEHMKEVNNEVTPDTFMEVARQIHRGEAVATGHRQNGFVLEGKVPQTDYSGNPLRRGYVVGYHTGDGQYVVGLMHKKSETVGQNDPKLKTRKNEYVKAAMYEVGFDQPGLQSYEPSAREIGEPTVERGDHVDDGYINGYRLTRLDDVLDSIFKWHEVSA